MKHLLFFIFTICLVSCKKNELYHENSTVETQQTSIFSRDGDHGEGDDDEDEGECCKIKYGEWQACSNNYQVRSWRASSPTCQPPLDSIQRQCASADVYYLYYNPQYTSLRVVTNADGFLRIYNADNQITAVLPYLSGARWVSVSFLPIGTYTVETYGVRRTFTR